MDTAADATMSDSSSTVAYAIPTGTLLDVADQILAGKAGNGVEIGATSYLGVVVSDSSGFNQSWAPAVPAGSTAATAGVTIEQVIAGSPAAKVGLQAGDEVVAVDGHAVTSAINLKALLTAHKPGSVVTLKLETVTGTETVKVTLVAGPIA